MDQQNLNQNNSNQSALQPIVIYPSKKKLISVTLVGALMLSIGIWIITIQDLKEGCNIILYLSPCPMYLVKIMGIFCILFFGGGDLYFIWRLINPKPSLVINEEGILDNSNVLSIGKLKWNEVSKVYVNEFMGNRMICVMPADTSSILSRLNPIKKILIKANIAITKALVNIPETTLPIPAEQAISLMQQYMSNSKTISTSVSESIQFDNNLDPLKQWNWGAFFFTWLWGIFNGVWISLLSLLPGVGFVMAFVLGFEGNEWAWKTGKWKNIEEFKKTQKKWAIASAIFIGILVLIVSLLFLTIYFQKNK